MARGATQDNDLLRQQIKALAPGDFEQLVFELVRREEPSVKRLTAPDAGADILKPSKRDQPAQVWQVKRYTGTINWKECEQSLENAIKRFRPSTVTFVFARDFSEKTETSFQQRLIVPAEKASADVDAWTLSELVRRLAEHEDLKVRFFGSDLENPLETLTRALHAGGALESGSDLIQRAKTLAEFTERIDPDLLMQSPRGVLTPLHPPGRNCRI